MQNHPVPKNWPNQAARLHTLPPDVKPGTLLHLPAPAASCSHRRRYPFSCHHPVGGCPFSHRLPIVLPLFLRQGAPPRSLHLQFRRQHCFSHRLHVGGCNDADLLPPCVEIAWPCSLLVLQSRRPVPLSHRSGPGRPVQILAFFHLSSQLQSP
jgi:hypothetical protein